MRTKRMVASVALAALATGFIGLTAAPASANERRDLYPTSWAYTDSEDPDKIFVKPAGDLPVGSWTDTAGKHHKSRSYFTFDLARFPGTRIHLAELVMREITVNDCAAAAPLELWRTDPVTANSSYRKEPKERELLASITRGGECPAYLTIDLAAALQRAADSGEQTFTIELRVRQAEEGDKHFGRIVRRPVWRTQANTVPQISGLGIQHRENSCGTEQSHPYVNGWSTGLTAKVTDPDQYEYSKLAYFELWPVGHPDQKIEIAGSARYDGTVTREWDTRGIATGTTFAWTARAFDGTDYSDYGPTCYLTVDGTSPVQAPLVSSNDYTNDWEHPWGGPGIAGTFTFDAQGDPDVVAYRYRFSFSGRAGVVQAPSPGAAVNVQLAPQSSWDSTLEVYAVDRAGNWSPETNYRFVVRRTNPTIEAEINGVGQVSRFTFGPRMENVVRYEYWLDEGPHTTVDADAEGRATVELTLTQTGHQRLNVESISTEGYRGSENYSFYLPSEPTVTSAEYPYMELGGAPGVEGTFVVTPAMSGVTEYIYSFNWGEEVVAPADAAGGLTFTWAPTEPGGHTLVIRSRTADGVESESRYYSLQVRNPTPQVWAEHYANWHAWGGIGETDVFHFRSELPGVTEFRYQLNGGAEQVVAAVDGEAAVTLAPDRGGLNTFTGYAVLASGQHSPAGEFTFLVNTAPTVSSAEYPTDVSLDDGSRPGVFTFSPRALNVVSYRYSINEGEQQTVAADAEGLASITFTPGAPGWYRFRVQSVDVDGGVSDERSYWFTINNPKPWVSSSMYGPYHPYGGVGISDDFRFATLVSDVDVFEYRLNDGPVQTVNNTDINWVAVQITPDRAGQNTLSVRGHREDGRYTEWVDYQFLVSSAPEIISSVYPENGTGGAVGAEGTFQVTVNQPGAVEFVYSFDGGAQHTVAAVGGAATIAYTPQTRSWHYLTVQTRTADGTLSDMAYYSFEIRS